MKKEYTIHELAELYDIGPDALRYYEKLGLISPRRGANGYRLYGLRDIYRLTIIRDLRQLDFPMARIGEYLDGLSLRNTAKLLTDEQKVIRQRIRELKAAEQSIRTRMAKLAEYTALPAGEVTLRRKKARPCVSVGVDVTRDEEVDFVIKKLHHRHNDTIRDLGSQSIGAAMDLEDLRQGVCGLYRTVFFLLEEDDDCTASDFLIPEGEYACLVYRGSYRQLKEQVQSLLDWCRQQGREPVGNVLELYWIDNRFTMQPEEFVTELQVCLEPPKQP